MNHDQAEFWASAINALFAGRLYIWTACYEYQQYEPEVRRETFDSAQAMHKPEHKHHWVMMHDSYGVADFSLEGINERIRIDADRRTLTIHQKTGAGKWVWWAMTDPDGDWQVWSELMRESWRVNSQQQQHEEVIQA